MTRALQDLEARRRIRDDVGSTFVVEAAAGTGKTTALVSRIVSIVRRGVGELRGIVAVTFTEAAAGEMKLRLRGALERDRVAESTTEAERDRLDRALAQLEEARISTIHALCVDLLRERPVEARVDPLFQVAPDDDARRLFDQAFDLWFGRALGDPPEGVRRALRRRRRGRDAQSPREVLRNAAFQLLDHRDFQTPWRRDPFDRDAEIDRLVEELRGASHLAAAADKPDDWLRPIFVKIATFVRELDRREAARGHERARDHDGLEAELKDLAHAYEWRWKGGGRWYAHGRFTRADVLAVKDRLKRELDGFAARADADLAAVLERELSPLAQAYEDLKAKAGRLDFLDLLLRTRDLVRDHRQVREDLQRRFTHFFVDEFQDTDPLQAEILLLLSADDPGCDDWTIAKPPPGKLFVVGDPKQSIYRFRRADVALYERIKRRLVEHGAEVLHLVTSFRSAPSLQEAVNASFALRMVPNDAGTQAAYVPLAPFRDDPVGQPAVIALPVPRPYAHHGKVTNKAIDASLPDAVGAFVDWLVRASGWTVTERDDPERRVPVAARHVCLLFKRLQSAGDDKTKPYVEALEARGIAHVLVGGRSFHAREEIAALRAVLAAIEWPDDELSVFATLRGPFFALGDDALLAFSAARGSAPFHPLRPLGPDSDGLPEIARPVADALAILRDLHRARNRRPIADTIGRFLEATRAHAGVAIWPTGEQSLANVLRLVDLARRFEASGGTSFRAFVEWLEDAEARGQASDAPVVEEGTDGVRIMTVHKAKGLEFPVVILVDPTAPLGPSSASRHVDHDRRLWVEKLADCAPIELLEHEDEVKLRDEEEAIRLAYVAATRARDVLVVPTIGDERRDGWLSVLDPSLHPHPRDRRRAAPAEGCPAFSADSVLERPTSCDRDQDGSVAPGSHAPEVGSHRVTWWDPRALVLDRQVDVGLRQQAILHADDRPNGRSNARSTEADTTRAHDAWRERRARIVEEGARPTLPTISVTGAAAEASRAGVVVAVERVDGDREGHPRGKRFGTLVHAVLAAVPLHGHDGHDGHGGHACASRVRASTEAHARLVGASEDEIEAAVARVTRALEHPLLRAARSGLCRREVPIALRDPSGRVIEGVVDLAFRDAAGEWTVIDFKTDAHLDREALAVYEAQVRIYVEAIAQATGARARGVLLSV